MLQPNPRVGKRVVPRAGVLRSSGLLDQSACPAKGNIVEWDQLPQALPSPSASRPCGSEPVTRIGPSTSLQSTSGGYGGTHGL